MGISFAPYVRNTFVDLQYLFRPTFSVEVGAYEASFSKQMKEAYPPIKAYAFEASASNYEKFSSELINFWGVQYLFGAVCDRVGSVDFNVQVDAPAAANNSVLSRVDSLQEKVSVPATTLDYFFIESGLMSESDSACLWLDVEGAAGLVLPSAERFLAQTSSVLVEVEHKQYWDGQWLSSDVHNFLTERGFYFLARDYEYYPNQENYLYVKGSL